MTDGDSLMKLVALLKERHIPRLGWPTTVLPPPGVRVSAHERASSVTVIVVDGRSDGTARLDLETREVVVSASGRDPKRRSGLRRLALEFVADRNDFDERCGLTTRPAPPTFDEHDSNTWTSLQLLADVTGSDWYPPPPAERSPSAWNAFYDMAHRFNDRVTKHDASARAPRPSPPPAARSSQDPATPDQQEHAAG
ncbi:hypothetical protein [Curtobacterium sp. PhB136]|uniref:hypothetical protein n=1 Tax=Curtobacterium sp. PhB136 TaxID=2485181 RepID=UPI001404FE24|nr:hypothetical protein [Curtobacterium sp. PhB136]